MKKLALTLLLTSSLPTLAQAAEPKTAIFAAGCFWCIEKDMEKVDGVLEAVSGYTGGTVENPTYEQVTSQKTGHYEAVRVTYDPDRVSYEELLEVFWDNHDPFDGGGQFCDKGYSYRGAIFADESQYAAAESYLKTKQEGYKQKIITPVLKAGAFYEAEEYHQDYYKKNPVKYKFYRWNCGRDQVLENLHGE